MKVEVFLKEEHELKEIDITDATKPEISDNFLRKWQNIINMTIDIIDVSAVLIMKISPSSMDVIVNSENIENPYKAGDKQILGHGFYCETVVSKNEKLFIKNALEKKAWKENPDIDLNMISYYGLPINWPDGKAFGTICILNDSEIKLKSNQMKLFETFKNIVEEDLALLIKEQGLNSLFDVNLDLLCIVTTNGNFIKVNSAWKDLLGYGTEQLENMNFLDLIHPDDLKASQKIIQKLENNEKVTNFVNRFKDSTDEYHYIQWNSKASGHYIYAAARDVTDKIEQKQENKKQRNRLDWIIEGIDAGTWEWNVQTGETVFNDKWPEMLGYNLDEISPTTVEIWKKYIHPEDLIIVEKNLDKHFSGENQIYDVEIRMKHKNGHWIWMSDRGKVISWTKENKPLKMFGIQINITKKKEKEKKLEQTQALIKNLTDQAPGVIYQFKLLPDGSFCFPYASKGIYEIYEVTSKDVIADAKKAFERIHPDDYQQLIDSIEKSAKNSSPWHHIYRVVLPKQGLKWVEGDSIPEALDDGSVVWYGNIKDITKQKKQHWFQETLAEISSSLLKINMLNIDRKINDSLKKIGEFFNIDRSYIFQLSEDNKIMTNTHEWCKKGIDSQKDQLQHLEVKVFPWGMSRLSSNQIITISNVKEMSSHKKAEQNLLQILNLESVVAMPIFIENELFGFFGFDTVKKKREFGEEDIRLLKIFTDVITSAFSKYVDDNKILKLTYNDSLTDLYNRRFFEKEVQRLDTRRQLPISIIVADINGLKIINDSLGHEKGDQLLVKSANILKNIIRDEDILARQGGDEFAILLPNTNKREAEKIINRIKKVSKLTKTENLTVSMALGTASKTKIDEDIYEVLKKADNNMYQNKLLESQSAKSKIVKSLLTTLEVKSYETKEHAMRMADLSIAFGEALGLSNSELNRLSLLSTLHDIGKTSIAEEILKKPGELTVEEWEIMRKHPERGYRIANSSQEFALVAEEIYAHHEKWSGEGYPRHLKGKGIPYLARIISIIDAYDVMTNERPYKKAVSKMEALQEIRNGAGTQFDPVLANIFIKIMEKDKCERKI